VKITLIIVFNALKKDNSKNKSIKKLVFMHKLAFVVKAILRVTQNVVFAIFNV